MKKTFLLFLFSTYTFSVDLYINNFNTDKSFFESVSVPDVYEKGSIGLYTKLGYQTSQVERLNNVLFLNTGLNAGISKTMDISANFNILNTDYRFDLSDGLFELKKQIDNEFSLSILFLPTMGEIQYINNSSHRMGLKTIYKYKFYNEDIFLNLSYIKSLEDNFYGKYKKNRQGIINFAHQHLIKDGIYVGNEVGYTFFDYKELVYTPHIDYQYNDFMVRNGVEINYSLRSFSAFISVNTQFERVFDSVVSDEYPIMSTYEEAVKEKKEEEDKVKANELRESIKAELKAEILAEIKNEMAEKEEKNALFKAQLDKIKNVKYKLDAAKNKMNDNIQLYENNQINSKEALKEISWGLRVIKLRKNYLEKLKDEYKQNTDVDLSDEYPVASSSDLETKAKNIISFIKNNNIKQIEIVKDSKEIEEEQKKLWSQFKSNKIGTIIEEKEKNLEFNTTQTLIQDSPVEEQTVEIISVKDTVKIEDHFRVNDVKSILQNMLESKKKDIIPSVANEVKKEETVTEPLKERIEDVQIPNIGPKKKTLDQRLEEVADDYEIISIENDSTDLKIDSYIQKSNGPAF